MSGSSPRMLYYCLRTDFESLDLDLDIPPPPPPSRPWILTCVRRQAVGFYSLVGGHGHNYIDSMAKTLHLEAYLADAPAISYLKIRGCCARATVVNVDNNLIIFQSVVYGWQSFLVYIVYDAVEQSISIIPYQPMEGRTADARNFLIARRPGPGDDATYAMVMIGQMYKCDLFRIEDVLFIWRSSSSQWEVITTSFPPQFKGKDCSDGFLAVVAFLCGGRAFWADLLRGVMYCSCDALLSAGSIGGDPKLEFSFIDLPLEHLSQLPHVFLPQTEHHTKVYRTMGRVGESSIKFVTIDGFLQRRCFNDCTVTVWSLSPEEDMTTWIKEHSLRLGCLAEQDEFKKAGLPTDLVPMYPHLSTEEDNIIYLMLGKYARCCSAHKRSKRKCVGNFPLVGDSLYFLRVDMRRGVLLSSAPLSEEDGLDFIVCDLNRHIRGADSSANDPETIKRAAATVCNDDNGRKESSANDPETIKRAAATVCNDDNGRKESSANDPETIKRAAAPVCNDDNGRKEKRRLEDDR